MYDVIEPNKLPPTICKHGCASWASQGQDIQALWTDGLPPLEASNHCAQPGLGVNDYRLGSWCRCLDPDPLPPAPPPKDPDHPLDGRTVYLYNTFASQDLYVGFALTDAPPGEPPSSKQRSWFQASSPTQQLAAPLNFRAVPGHKDVYTLYNLWGDSEYQHYLGRDANDTYFISSSVNYTNATAMRVLVEPTGKAQEYTLVDNSTGNYISYMDDGAWLRAAYASVSEAMTVQLVPAGASPTVDWGYCRSSGDGDDDDSPGDVPEQINVQIAGPDSVVVSFVTFGGEHRAWAAAAAAAAAKGLSPPPVPVPTVRFGRAPDALTLQAPGITHNHTTAAGNRVYYMHFVHLTGLTERVKYYYSVRSAAASNATTSEVYSFRAGYSSGVTKVDVYGDMGVYTYNNMVCLPAFELCLK